MRSAAPTCTIPSSPAGGSVRTADSDAAAAAAAAVFSQRSLVSEPWAAAALSSAGQATPEPIAVKQAPVQCGPVGLAVPGPGETARPAVRRPAATRPRASRSVSPSESEARRRGAPLPPLQLASVVPVPSTSLSPAAAPDSDVQEQRSREAPVGYESDHPPMGKTDSDGPPAFLPALALACLLLRARRRVDHPARARACALVRRRAATFVPSGEVCGRLVRLCFGNAPCREGPAHSAGSAAAPSDFEPPFASRPFPPSYPEASRPSSLSPAGVCGDVPVCKLSSRLSQRVPFRGRNALHSPFLTTRITDNESDPYLARVRQ